MNDNDMAHLILLALMLFGVVMFCIGYIAGEFMGGWMMLDNYQNRLAIHQYALEDRLCVKYADNVTLGVCSNNCSKPDAKYDYGNEWSP